MNYAQAVIILRARLGGYIDEAGLTNDHFEACLSWGVRQSGGSTINHDQVTNPEIASVDADMLLDFAELCMIKSIIGNLPYVDITVGPRKQALSQLSKHLFMLKENKEKYMEATYGFGLGTLETGYINLNFQQG